MTLSLLGWTWGNPWMLLAGLAIGIPILIHLWNRNRYENIDWAAMRFLMQAVKENSRRFTIQQLILLAIRITIFILLALALANPWLPRFDQAGLQEKERRKTHHLIMIDASYSMGYLQGERSAFEQAKARASRLVQKTKPGDGFTLIKLAQPPEVIIREPAFDQQSVQREINGLAISVGGADLDAALAEVESMIERAAQSHPELTRVQTTVLTDLGENTWSAVRSGTTKQRLDRIAKRCQLVVNEVSGKDRNNHAIVSVRQNPTRLRLNQRGYLQVELRNFGVNDFQEVSIEMIVDGQTQKTKKVSAANDSESGNASVLFPVEFEIPGDHAIEFQVSNDSLPIDDCWYKSIVVRDSMRVLCVDGRPGESNNIKWALHPQLKLQNGDFPKVDIKTISAGTITEQDLGKFDCIVLANVPGFSAEQTKRLHQFVSAGGGLMVFMGDAVRIDNYNQRLFEDEFSRILPGRLTGYSDFKLQTLDPLEYQHPIIEPFRGTESAGLLSTPIWKYVRLETDEASESNKVLAFQNADPLIVENQIGFGRVVVFTSAGSRRSVHLENDERLPWTEFQTWPSFVVLVHEMVSFVVGGNSEAQNLVVGDMLAGEVQSGMKQVKLEMIGPKGRSIPLSFGEQISGAFSAEVWNAGEVADVGFYELTDRADPNVFRKFAVNLDTRESDVSQIEPGELPVQIKNELAPAVAEAKPVSNTSVFQFILTGLAALLIAESCFAWLFGKPRN